MRIDYLYLFLALALLWLPLAVLLGRRLRRELRNPARGVLVSLPTLLRSPWAWIDLLRAAGGLWLLMNLAVQPLPPPARPTPTTILLIRIGIPLVLLIGVWIQVMITGSRRLRLAPLFYLIGIMALLLPWQVALFGGMLGLTLTGMLRRWQLIFWLMPGTLIAAAVLFRAIGIPIALIAVLYVLPGLLGLRTERPLSWVFTPVQSHPVDDDERHRPRRRRNREVPISTAKR